MSSCIIQTKPVRMKHIREMAHLRVVPKCSMELMAFLIGIYLYFILMKHTTGSLFVSKIIKENSFMQCLWGLHSNTQFLQNLPFLL